MAPESVREEELGDICDEGGSHSWAKEATPFDYFCCIACCPFYALVSCMMSEGAALANPVMEQCLGKKNKDSGGDPVCRKCGLTREEAQNLNSARRDEMRKSGVPGYFSGGQTGTAGGELKGTGPERMQVPQGVA